MPKRKRDSESTTTVTTTTTTALPNRDAINAIFRANFESKFGSIDVSPVVIPDSKTPSLKSSKKRKEASDITSDDGYDEDFDEDEDEDSEENLDSNDSDDSNAEEDEEEPQTSKPPEPEIITYDFSRRGPPPTTKPSHRSFMSSKPPSSSTSSNPTTTTTSSTSSKLSKSEQAAEALNLKNDQALHRLLTESHLLDSQTLSHSSAKNRHKAIESRIISLGGAPLKQHGNIPMNIQKGIKHKQKLREDKIRKEARENGVIIDKESKRAKERRKEMERRNRRKGERRDAGVGHASIGKFRGGELRLSRRDVAGMRA